MSGAGGVRQLRRGCDSVERAGQPQGSSRESKITRFSREKVYFAGDFLMLIKQEGANCMGNSVSYHSLDTTKPAFATRIIPLRRARWGMLLLLAGSFLFAVGSKEGDKKGTRLGPEDVKPEILNIGTNPTLRYPVMRYSGLWTSSITYGWLDLTRDRLRYIVVRPEKKESSEGLDIPAANIHDVGVGLPWGIILHFTGGAGKKNNNFIYLPEDHWGKIHTSIGVQHAYQDGTIGTQSIAVAMGDFDSAVDGLLAGPVRRGDLVAVKALIEAHPDLTDYRNKDLVTLLHVAAAAGKNEIAELLLDSRADVNAKNDKGKTPMLEAVSNGHAEMVALLLSRGANLNVTDVDGETALYAAATKGNRGIALLLLDKGADPNVRTNAGNTPLYAAQPFTEIASLLCARIASCESIYRAAKDGDASKIKRLVASEPDLVFGRDEAGRTPLHYASINGYKDASEELLTANAVADALDNDGVTPLIMAARAGHKDLAEALIAHGADPISRSAAGILPSVEAGKSGHPEVAEFLRQQEPVASARFVNEAAMLLGMMNTERIEQQLKGRLSLPLLVNEQHPVQVHLESPTLPISDISPGELVFLEKSQFGKLVEGVVRGKWEDEGNGQLTLVGGPESGGSWYVQGGEHRFRGGVVVAGHSIAFISGEVVSTARWDAKCTEGTRVKIDGVDYKLNGGSWTQVQ